MNQKLATIISYLLHPLLAPTFTFLILMFLFPSAILDYNWSAQNKLLFIFAVFLLTYMIPGTATYLLSKSNHIESIELGHQKDRHIPLILTIITYSITTIFCYKNVSQHPNFYIIMAFNTALLGVIFLINFVWKISAHSAGMGGLVTYYFIFAQNANQKHIGLFFVLILLTGVVLSSRIALKAHTPWQCYLGFLTGVGTTALISLFI